MTIQLEKNVQEDYDRLRRDWLYYIPEYGRNKFERDNSNFFQEDGSFDLNKLTKEDFDYAMRTSKIREGICITGIIMSSLFPLYYLLSKLK